MLYVHRRLVTKSLIYISWVKVALDDQCPGLWELVRDENSLLYKIPSLNLMSCIHYTQDQNIIHTRLVQCGSLVMSW